MQFLKTLLCVEKALTVNNGFEIVKQIQEEIVLIS